MQVLGTNVIRCGGRFGSFAFAKALALCVGAKANVPLVRLAKIVFKKVRCEKIKHEGLGLSVGLLPFVELKYGQYVVHVSR
ncbi:MAG: hypothetical protein QM530_03700 [Phycisphaerales bacterium]|nr:hypothetical protein [Phycisphaerales bacterium]